MPMGRVARYIRRYVEADGVSEPLMDTIMPGLYTVASRTLSQQTGTINAKLDA